MKRLSRSVVFPGVGLGETKHARRPDGALGFRAGNRGTIGVGSLLGAPTSEDPMPGAPGFARTRRAARTGWLSAASGGDPAPWTIDLTATLERPAPEGDAVFLIYDADRPAKAVTHEVAALHQGWMQAGRTVAARLELTSDEGFRAGHTYRIRVVQLIHDREIQLAEGNVRLL